MKFLFLLRDDSEAVAALTREERMRIVGEHIAYAAMLRELGAYVSGEALAEPDTAAVSGPARRRS